MPSWPLQGQVHLCLWIPNFTQVSSFCGSRIVHRHLAFCFSDILDPYHQQVFPSGYRPFLQLSRNICKIRFPRFLVKQDSSPTEALAKTVNRHLLQIHYMSRDRAFAISSGLLKQCTKWLSGSQTIKTNKWTNMSCIKNNTRHISASVGFNSLWILRMHGATIKMAVRLFQ
jgi:hypothetical protein